MKALAIKFTASILSGILAIFGGSGSVASKQNIDVIENYSEWESTYSNYYEDILENINQNDDKVKFSNISIGYRDDYNRFEISIDASNKFNSLNGIKKIKECEKIDNICCKYASKSIKKVYGDNNEDGTAYDDSEITSVNFAVWVNTKKHKYVWNWQNDEENHYVLGVDDEKVDYLQDFRDAYPDKFCCVDNCPFYKTTYSEKCADHNYVDYLSQKQEYEDSHRGIQSGKNSEKNAKNYNSSASSSSSSSANKNNDGAYNKGCYDVDDYDSPEEFAEDADGEFDDSDDAYDYWEENY